MSPIAICTAPQSLAVEVTVTDSVSGLGLAGGAAGSIQTLTNSDSLQHLAGSPTLLVGGSQLGTYTVTVTSPGYAAWIRSGVSVTQVGVCGNVIPVQLMARMQPVP